jgi:hypothetical protein
MSLVKPRHCCRELAQSESRALEVSYIAEFGIRLDGSVDGGHNQRGTTPLQPPQLGTGTTPLKLNRTAEATTSVGPAQRSASAVGASGGATSGAKAASAGIAISTLGASQRDSATAALNTPPQPTTAAGGEDRGVHITPERNPSGAQVPSCLYNSLCSRY